MLREIERGEVDRLQHQRREIAIAGGVGDDPPGQVRVLLDPLTRHAERALEPVFGKQAQDLAGVPGALTRVERERHLHPPGAAALHDQRCAIEASIGWEWPFRWGRLPGRLRHWRPGRDRRRCWRGFHGDRKGWFAGRRGRGRARDAMLMCSSQRAIGRDARRGEWRLGYAFRHIGGRGSGAPEQDARDEHEDENSLRPNHRESTPRLQADGFPMATRSRARPWPLRSSGRGTKAGSRRSSHRSTRSRGDP